MAVPELIHFRLQAQLFRCLWFRACIFPERVCWLLFLADFRLSDPSASLSSNQFLSVRLRFPQTNVSLEREIEP
jgi:hypothetical protein